VYIYIYKKFDFELQRHVDSEVNIPGMCHVYIGDTNPLEIMKMISGDATVLIEHPHPAALPYLQICNARGLRTVFELIDDWETSLGGDWFDIGCYRKIVEQSKVVVGRLMFSLSGCRIWAGWTRSISRMRLTNTYSISTKNTESLTICRPDISM
jgi:hypothetical protein